ncbi:DMT family transporter [Oceaniglobus roseus]|uniref:DMT family transporter n=1 Tax=Oceaniglobus roseus TaxID=1737570 RepID=UPI000C7EC9E4|nr:DMT family transporter [Kandeliimicrobium roseum]
MRRETLELMGVLVLLGIGWGATQPLGKIAVSTGHQPLGLIFWQLTLGALILGTVQAVRGRGLPGGRRQVGFYLLIALIGTVLPNSASYAAIRHLPSGVISILLSLVPMFAFPVALAMRNEGFSKARLLGLLLGATGVILLAAPETALPDPAMAVFLPLALVAPLFYALEGNVVSRWGTHGLDPVEVLLGASIAGAVVALPLAVVTGQWVNPLADPGPPEVAILVSAVIHAVVYTTYVWLVGRAGAVFAAQVSYLVTAAGLLWAMALLGERYTGWIWAAVAVMFAGLFLVQPRPRLPDLEDTPGGGARHRGLDRSGRADMVADGLPGPEMRER